MSAKEWIKVATAGLVIVGAIAALLLGKLSSGEFVALMSGALGGGLMVRPSTTKDKALR